MSPRASVTGFTLIELLVVIAIIAILAGISFGVVKGVNERAARAQAEAELSALSVALEAYKTQYGDYPQTGSNLGAASTNANMFAALAGSLGPKLGTIEGRSFVDVSRFSTDTSGAVLDPWGRRYLFAYRTNANDPPPPTPPTWRRRGYILFSAGPDGQNGISINNTGAITVGNAAQAADNLYANGLTP
jgi:prepilin-type N-terminal cleavage/methylation domain-containing protein